MKVLIINYEFPPLGGGAGNTTAHLAKELVRQGTEVMVLTSGFFRFQGKEYVVTKLFYGWEASSVFCLISCLKVLTF